jgi:hypothetical protein
VVDFSGAGEKSRQHFFKKFERIVKLFKNADGEEVVLDIVHRLHHRLLRDFVLSRSRIAWKRVAAEELDELPRDRLHALRVVLFYALIHGLGSALAKNKICQLANKKNTGH